MREESEQTSVSSHFSLSFASSLAPPRRPPPLPKHTMAFALRANVAALPVRRAAAARPASARR